MSLPEPMHRLFVAIDVPEEVKVAVSQCQKRIKSWRLVEGSYPNAKDTHLTLKFLGSMEESKIPSLIVGLNEIRFDALSLDIKPIGTFPLQSMHPRVVWLGVGGQGLAKLAADVENASSCVAEPSENPFHAHLTLMRVKKCQEHEKFFENMREMSVQNIAFVAKRFALFESKLSGSGPQYTRLAEFECQTS